MNKMVLNERQIKAVQYVAENGKITNKQYQEFLLFLRMEKYMRNFQAAQ